MMTALYTLQAYAMLALAIAIFGAAVFCLVEALRYPTQAYVAAGKLTKTWWLVILGIATVVAFTGIGPMGGYGIFSLLSVIAVGVFLADVRPALKPYRQRKNPRPGASGNGPYGSW